MVDFWILGRPFPRRSAWIAAGIGAILFCHSARLTLADGAGGRGGGITGGAGGTFGQVGGNGGVSGGGGGGGSAANGGSGDNGATSGGSAGNPTGGNGQSGAFSGGGGGGGANGFNTSGTLVTATPLTGGVGGNGGDAADEGAGGGGAGGYGAIVGGSGLSTNSSPGLTIAGGAGGRGGDSVLGFGGDGGEGGAGVSFTAVGVQFRNSASASVRGGDGGRGGFAVDMSSGNTGGRGGDGGSGLLFAGSGAVFDNSASARGGEGGRGGDGVTGMIGGGGRGGDGGFGARFTGAGATLNNTGSGSIRGGNAGQGGTSFTGFGGDGGIGGTGVQFSGASAVFNNSATVQGGAGGTAGIALGTGGAGGVGVDFVGSGSVLTNSGTIAGGMGGVGATTPTSGLGGVGVRGGDLTVINSGTISGGISGGVLMAQSEAVKFTAGTNILELRAGSTINGAALAFSAADTLRFGGSADAAFDATNIGLQYVNFGVFEKTGSSHWTLTGTAGQVTNFTITDGILTLGSTNTLNASSDITVNGVNATFDIGANSNIVDQFTLINGSVTGTTGLLTVSANLDVIEGRIAADISVLNDLNKVGAGVATIETDSTVIVASDATVFNGQLLVNGELNNNVVQAVGSGVIGGAGTIFGSLTLDGGGAVDPGATVHGIGTLTVVNQFNINAGGGTVHVDFNGTANDVLAASSVALNPNSSVFVHYIGPGTPTANTPYTFLTSTLPLGGAQFGSISEDFPLVEFQLGYTDFTAYFFFDRTSPIFTTIAQTPNERAVANYLDQNAGNSTGDFGFVVDNLLLLNANQARAALNQMSGEAHATAGQAGINTTTIVVQQVANHLSSLSMSGPSSGGPTVNMMAQVTPTSASPIQQVSYSDEIVLDRPANDEIVLAAPAETLEDKVVGWSGGYGLGGSAQSDGNASGASYGVGGVIAGVDRWLDDSTLVGVFGGYLSSGFTTGTPSANVHDNAGYGGLYALRRGEILYANAIVGGQADNYTTHRNINFGAINRTATGNYDGWQGFGYSEIGANLGNDRITLQPFGALQYIHLRQNSISETGAGSLNLVSGGLDTDSLRSFLGTRLRYDNHGEKHLRRIVPELQASWLHEYIDSSTSLSTRFGAVGGTNFNITGLNVGRDWALLGAGLTYVITDNVRITANYYTQTNDRQTYHVGAGGLSIQW